MGLWPGRLNLGQELPGQIILGLKAQSGLEVRHRFVGLARGLEQRNGEVNMDRGNIRFQAQRLFILGDRRRCPARQIRQLTT